jgi:hypothetical protein
MPKKRECMRCVHFRSYQSEYEDHLEPEDAGFCLKDKRFEHTCHDEEEDCAAFTINRVTKKRG